ncbi:MAG: enoyl-CoA hydratase/isomerase family protein [Beijerinckiaceae bacterium]|nr:enoyl-CoA hydratase/isomerase family protein [Beijerinckiaceae bacterium]
MAEAYIDYRRDGAIARLVLTQPAKLNAITFDMWAGLPALVAKAQDDAQTRLIVVEGAGHKAFSAGADISQFAGQRSAGETARAYEQAAGAALDALAQAQKPTIALVRGLAFGGGLALAMCCDLRIGASDARFRIPAARLGIGYSFANVEALAARIGVDAAADLLLTARTIDGNEAERMGLLSKAWPGDAFEAAALDYIEAIAANAPLTLRALKRALIECRKPPNARDALAVNTLVEACMNSADYIEGQAAFREKRPPRFRGA